MSRKALGKGLDALLPTQPKTGAHLVEIDIDQIAPNPFQPRVQFDDERLEELAASIRQNGVLQPVVVRRAAQGYELVAGERRWRAAQKAGLPRIPALVQDLSDDAMLVRALVENIQREDLNVIEEATAYQLMVERFHLTQDEIAQRVGRSRTAVTNTLRLLRLPQPIQQAVLADQLNMGHARALLSLSKTQQLALAKETASRGLSVREVERRVQRLLNPPEPRQPRRDPNVAAAEHALEERLKTRVQIQRASKGGRIVLYFYSDDELDRLYGLLSAPS
jgi:ParB family chromosome partitioning protein